MVRRFGQVVMYLLIAAAIVFLALVAALAFFQRALIYPIPPVTANVPAGFERISYETSDGLELQAGYRPATGGQPTVLFFHGNGSDWKSTFYTTELIAARGFGVLAAEYRGYSGNPSAPSEQGLYRDGRAALAWLRAQGIADDEIVLAGNSLGSGIATQLASEFAPKALIIISGFKSMTATASNHYPWAPVDLLLRDRFDNISKIAQVSAPILVLHGTEDRLIPVAHAQQLARTNPEAVFVEFTGAGHNMSADDAPQMAQLKFLEQLAD